MKKILLVMFMTLPYAFTQAQSVNLDREKFNVSYVKLPSNPILDDKARTYDINVVNAMSSSSRAKITKNKVNIAGFSKLDDKGTLGINIDINDIEIGDVDIKKSETKSEDKEGNVTVTRRYTAVVQYKTYATMDLTNNIDGTSNRQSYGGNKVYNSTEYSTYSKARDYYNNNRGKLRNNFRSEFFNSVLGDVNYYLNSTYGYRKHQENEFLKILKSKKHPEHAKHHENFEVIKAAFAEMKSDQPVDDIAKKAEPVIAYFNEVITRYPGKDRKSKKVRYASYYNIAKIYYYLDNPDKAMEYADKLIENDHSKGDGKSMNRISERLKKSFDVNKIKTRHIEVVTEDLTGNESIDEDIAEEETTGAEEEFLTYLITKNNDTITAKIAASELNNISYTAKLKVADKDGNEGETVYKAKNAIALALTNGDVYETVDFKESAAKDGALDLGKSLAASGPKFAKVLHKSDKIELYLFAGKEIIIKKPEDEKGKSTTSTGFLFAFKKKLAGIVSDCPELAQRAKSKEFKNNVESLIKFCEAYDACGNNTK